MNYIWCGMIVISIIVSIFTGRVEETINGAFEGAKSSVFVVLSFAGVMCFWTGLMKIMEKSGISKKIEFILKPIINFLFPTAGKEAKGFIAMNISANLLGMGNAATPMGIKAMECLDKENKNPLYASKDMCMLVIINTASLQILPTTIIALRSAVGSTNPFSVILPIWISSFVALIAAVIPAKLLLGRKKL